MESIQNIMCECSFHMRFIHVMRGWEGTTNDSRLFLECVTNPDNSFIFLCAVCLYKIKFTNVELT